MREKYSDKEGRRGIYLKIRKLLREYKMGGFFTHPLHKEKDKERKRE